MSPRSGLLLGGTPRRRPQPPRSRVFVLRVLVLSMLLTLGTRLWFMEIIDGPSYQKVASGNTTRAVVTPAPRGMIVDDSGRPLVQNKTSLVLTVDRSVIERQRDGGKATLARLAPIVGQTEAQLAERIRLCTAKVSQPCWNGSPYQPIPVASNVSSEQALAVLEHPELFPGVTADLQPVPGYPQGALAGHELGYVSAVTAGELKKDKKLNRSDMVGRAGLEQTYDADLRGVDGVKTVSVDRFGRVTGTVSAKPAVPGNTLVLSMDLKAQQVLQQALQNAINSAKLQGKPADSASGVVLNVKTGQVVAMASLPSYDPAVFTGGISQQQYDALTNPAAGDPLISRAYQGAFAPGSTFKIVSASVALTDLGAGQDTLYPCPSDLQIGNQSFHNFDSEALGDITIHTALVMSCDTVFYKFGYDAWLQDGGLRTGPGPYPPAKEYFVKMARVFSFGHPTGIDLPGETSGVLIDRANRKATWEANKATYCKRARTGYPDVQDPVRAAYLTELARENCADGYLYRGGDAVQLAIGQNLVDVSPLQLAVAYAAVANGGTVWHPRLGKAVINQNGVVRKIPPSKAGTLPISQDTLHYLQDAFAGVTTSGTSSGVFAGFPIHTAGKTGTAETFDQGDVSWYASYGPVEDPQYAIVIAIPHTGQGALFAAPAVRDVWAGLYGIGQPAALPGGQPPATLPCLQTDGTVALGSRCAK